MSAQGFKSVFMVASVAGAALGCYLVSLNVASERAKLEAVENKIVLAQRDIRVLQTEIGTRGRLAQLERWNVGFIRLSAPTADQFLEGGFQLATMVKPDARPTIDAPVVLASATVEQRLPRQPSTSDADEAKPGDAEETRPVGATRDRAPSATDMMHVASYQRPAATPRALASSKPKSAIAKPVAARGAKIAAADSLAPLSMTKSTPKSTPKPALKPIASASRTKDIGTSR